MTHPLEHVMRSADGFLLIGESSQGRFPAFSYHAYTSVRKRFYCLDLAGLTESRGPTKGGNVYAPRGRVARRLRRPGRDLGSSAHGRGRGRACAQAECSASGSASSLATATPWPGCASSAWRWSRSVAAPSTTSTTKAGVCKAHTLMVKVSGAPTTSRSRSIRTPSGASYRRRRGVQRSQVRWQPRTRTACAGLLAEQVDGNQ